MLWGIKTYYDENGDEVAEAPGGGTPASVQALINTCKSECEEEDIVQTNLCDIRKAMMKEHMSPGGQYFDNTTEKYLRLTDGSFDLDANGDLQHNTSYNINDWVSNSSNISDPISTIFSGHSFADWDDVRDNWEAGFADLLLPYHPEYCAYEFYCTDLAIELESPGTYNTVTYADRTNYDDLMFDQKSDADFENNSSLTFNFFNPSALANNSSKAPVANEVLYQPYTYIGAGDPLLNGSQKIHDEIESLLLHFIPKSFDPATSTTGTGFSIWYVLDDPDGISVAKGGNTPAGMLIRPEARDLFNLLHGDGTNSGMIGSSAGQIEKYEFFRSIYSFYKEYFMYTALNDEYDCVGNHIEFSAPPPSANRYTYGTDTDYNGLKDVDHHRLVFPPNPLFDKP